MKDQDKEGQSGRGMEEVEKGEGSRPLRGGISGLDCRTVETGALTLLDCLYWYRWPALSYSPHSPEWRNATKFPPKVHFRENMEPGHLVQSRSSLFQGPIIRTFRGERFIQTPDSFYAQLQSFKRRVYLQFAVLPWK